LQFRLGIKKLKLLPCFTKLHAFHKRKFLSVKSETQVSFANEATALLLAAILFLAEE
jgi:hypothetical protein